MMPKYDYRVETTDNIKNYINENFNYIKDYSLNELYNELWTADNVTGNGSGSFTFSSYEAEEMLCHNLYLLADALEEFGVNPDTALNKGAEYCDVTIRCYLLSECLDEAIEELGYGHTGLFPEEG